MLRSDGSSSKNNEQQKTKSYKRKDNWLCGLWKELLRRKEGSENGQTDSVPELPGSNGIIPAFLHM